MNRTTLLWASLIIASLVVASVGGPLASIPTATAAGLQAEPTKKLVIWNHPTAPDAAAEQQFWTDLGAAFTEANPGVEVEVVWVPWDQMYVSKINAIKSGEVPDISFMGVEQSIEFAAMDAIIPVDDIIEELGGPEATTGFMKNHLYEGHYWGVPYQEGGYLLYVRKDLLEAAGYSDPCPKDWDELVEMARAIHDPENSVYAIALDYSAGNGTTQLYLTFWAAGGGQILDEEGRVAINTPENAETLQFYTDLWTKYDLLPPGVTTVTTYGTSTATPIDDWYLDGQVGMMVRNMSNAVLWEEQQPEMWANTQVCEMPKGPSGHTGTFSQPGVLYIFKGSENQELAKDFLRFFFQADWQERWAVVDGIMPLLNGAEVPAVTDQYWYPFIAAEQEWGVRMGFPQTHPQNLVAHESFWPALMVQDVVLNEMSVEDALVKWQEEVEEIYGEPCSPLVEGCE